VAHQQPLRQQQPLLLQQVPQPPAVEELRQLLLPKP